ncbi:unnamed protein product [Coffea canephora]|uniref:Protein NRT1/ PTR FAMILY 2.7-like n=1 Tax=Coffea canephora TaxID=49390 RepID=A0A068UK76_COFCA|nr:unnamed protein product [Coffea canephora]
MSQTISSMDTEAHSSIPQTHHRKGGWITFPFITATMAGLTLSAAGWVNNLIVYLITEFNVKSIDAAQIFNVVNGCMALFPVLGAVIADSFVGCFSVIWVSSIINLLGIVLFTFTAALSTLRPKPCSDSSLCEGPSEFQYAILILAMGLGSIGAAGTRFTMGTMGANQLDNPKHQENFFNWFLFTWNTASIIAATAIVYVQDDVSWAWGFGICVVANVLGLIIFLAGRRFYRNVKPQGSPFKSLACVIIAAISKRKLQLSAKAQDYHNEIIGDEGKQPVAAAPTESFKFLNRAALVTQSDTEQYGSIKKSWKLCTVQQVEDLKTLIRIIPLWISGIFLSTPIGIQASLTIVQALTMDRHIGPNFKIPSASIMVFVLISGAVSLPIIDRLLCPIWEKVLRRPLTPLQRLGIGHSLTVLSMAISALVEAKRLQITKAHNLQDSPVSVVPMSILWLVPQLIAVGMGEAFHFPGQASLYYQEFPASLKSTSTALVAMLIGIAFYLSSAFIDLFRRMTNWLPDNINQGRLDNVYWVLVVIGGVNFVYYLVCASLYRYQNSLPRNNG